VFEPADALAHEVAFQKKCAFGRHRHVSDKLYRFTGINLSRVIACKAMTEVIEIEQFFIYIE
jgi:hypothetical protein